MRLACILKKETLTNTIYCAIMKMKFVFVFIRRWIAYFSFGKVRK